MHVVQLLFSPNGRLAPPTFVAIAVAIYIAGTASQLLTMPGVIARAGLWPFVFVQAALIWMWFAVHAKRLKDAGHGIGLAAGVAILYALAVVLLVILATSFFVAPSGLASDANTASALGLILFVAVVSILLGSPHFDLGSVLVAVLVFLAIVPIVLAVAVTLWAAVQPTREESAA